MFPQAFVPKIAQVWYLKSKGCYKKMPGCLWSIPAIRQGLFLAWALTLPLTVTAAREALSRELPWAEPGARAGSGRGSGDYITVAFLGEPSKLCISQSSSGPAAGAPSRGLRCLWASRAGQVSQDIFIAHTQLEALSYHSLFQPPYLNSGSAGFFYGGVRFW